MGNVFAKTPNAQPAEAKGPNSLGRNLPATPMLPKVTPPGPPPSPAGSLGGSNRVNTPSPTVNQAPATVAQGGRRRLHKSRKTKKAKKSRRSRK